MLNSRVLRILVITFPIVTVIGCNDSPEIRVYKIPKETGQRALAMSSQAEAAVEKQLLGAILPNGNAAWFFKLTGEPEVVDKNRQQFREMVDSVAFDASGEPSWQLAEGWSQQLAQGMSYAKLNKQSDGLTATVTRLFNIEGNVPWNESSWRNYVTENVNRWRGQLALSEQQWENLEQELEEVAELSQGPAKAYFVAMTGKGSGSMRGPFQGPATSAVPESKPPATTAQNEATPPAESLPPTAAPKPSVRGQTPESWTELDVSSSQMRLLAFAVASEAEAKPEVTVVEAGGDIEANLGMWMNQVALERTPESVDGVVKAATKVTVSGIDGLVYWLDGSQTEAGQAILVADIPWKETSSLFVKMKGDFESVQAEKENFIRFLESITWGDKLDEAGEEPTIEAQPPAPKGASSNEDPESPPREEIDATTEGALEDGATDDGSDQ